MYHCSDAWNKKLTFYAWLIADIRSWTLFLKSIDGYHIQETGALWLHLRAELLQVFSWTFFKSLKGDISRTTQATAM